jgi:hypothetical protein
MISLWPFAYPGNYTAISAVEQPGTSFYKMKQNTPSAAQSWLTVPSIEIQFNPMKFSD